MDVEQDNQSNFQHVKLDEERSDDGSVADMEDDVTVLPNTEVQIGKFY